MLVVGAVAALFAIVFAEAAVLYDGDAVMRALPRRWSHPPSHPVHRLFHRANPTPTAGSPEWKAQYPSTNQAPLPESRTPQLWLAALAAAEKAGKIPNIPASVPQSAGSPQYPSGNPAGPLICSSTPKCRVPDDIWDAPDGHVGIGFDDGPTYGSSILYQFLQSQNQSATHFMIGINILNNHDLFDQAFSRLNDDIGVHTWTHPYMTTQNNTQIVAQLGWTMQIIHDLTGGRVPRYWRPPFGDSDNRVRAIAREVFNITQIDWNHDSADWTMNTAGGSQQIVEASVIKLYNGPKTPGLIILQHELTANTSTAFIHTYPSLKSNGWKAVSVVQLFNGSWQNAQGNYDSVQNMDIVGTTIQLPTATIDSTGAKKFPSPSPGTTASQGGQPSSAYRTTSIHLCTFSIALLLALITIFV